MCMYKTTVQYINEKIRKLLRFTQKEILLIPKHRYGSEQINKVTGTSKKEEMKNDWLAVGKQQLRMEKL